MPMPVTTNLFYARIADIVFRFSCKTAFDATAAKFQGFGVAGSVAGQDVVDVEICDYLEPLERVEHTFSASESDCANSHSWAVGRAADGREFIEVNYHSQSPTKRVYALLHDANHVQVAYEGLSTKLVAYSFPFFNLLLSRLLLSRGGFLVHSSVVRNTRSEGLLFTAPSGTGKSTMANLWRSTRKGTVINDDMLAVRLVGGKPVVYNIPMPYYVQTPRQAPLCAVFFLSQSPQNTIQKVSGVLAMARFLSNVVQQPVDKESVERLYTSVDNVVCHIPMYALGFRPDRDVVSLIEDTLIQ